MASLDHVDWQRLCAEDRLAHAVIHGAYSNRLDGGPLTLPDIAAMVRLGGIDWPGFWARAERGNWARGAALLFHLADEYCCPGVVERTRCSLVIAPAVRERAPDLLLQNLDARKTVGMVAGLASRMHEGGLAAAAGAALTRLRGQDRGLRTAGENGQPVERLARWAGRRLRETAGAVADSEVRAVARSVSRLGQWLDGQG